MTKAATFAGLAMSGLMIAASADAVGGAASGELQLPVARVWRLQPVSRDGSHTLPKLEVEYAIDAGNYRTTLKAEHDADVDFANLGSDHETKLEVELRRSAASMVGWEPYVRVGVLSSGPLRESFSSPGDSEVAVGIKRRLEFGRSVGTMEVRLARRDDLRGDGHAWRPGLKLKWYRPVGRGWKLSSEATVIGVERTGAPRRFTAKVRVFLLRRVGLKETLQFGAMAFADGTRQAPPSTLRVGVGPALVATW